MLRTDPLHAHQTRRRARFITTGWGSISTRSSGAAPKAAAIPSTRRKSTVSNDLQQNSTVGSRGNRKGDVSSQFQGFFAVQYGLWDRVFIKLVGSRASFHFEGNLQTPSHSFTNGMWGGHLRLMYLF
jgi:hypothetical protein